MIVNWHIPKIDYRYTHNPFGSVMQGRNWTDVNRNYRYGFNGKEKDFETANDNYDFGARIYDGRLGRWLSLDPLMEKYVELSPYNYCGNIPTLYIDPSGAEIINPYTKLIRQCEAEIGVVHSSMQILSTKYGGAHTRKSFKLNQGSNPNWRVDWANYKQLNRQFLGLIEERKGLLEIEGKVRDMINVLANKFPKMFSIMNNLHVNNVESAREVNIYIWAEGFKPNPLYSHKYGEANAIQDENGILLDWDVTLNVDMMLGEDSKSEAELQETLRHEFGHIFQMTAHKTIMDNWRIKMSREAGMTPKDWTEAFNKWGHHPDDLSGKRADEWNDLTKDLPVDFDVTKP